ncbi:MAG: lamin tail domain-containing protein [Planctomycetaceae bacterium]|nr:lamin tail domain-containing protein [Planctomycetaceae bacterium]
MKKLLVFAVLLVSCLTGSANADVIISQYYEGTSNNKWIEITNVGNSAIDLGAGNYKLSGFQNANRELWKTGNDASINGGTFSLTGTLAAGSTIWLRHNLADTPAYALGGSINAGTSGVNFNGDDSVVLWAGTSFSFANVVDVFGVTASTAANTSFVRNADVLTGTNADFNASQWQQFTNLVVDGAGVGTTERIGFHSFNAVPEPGSLLIMGTVVAFGAMRRRR